jgi:hypothetical protein
MDGFVKALFSVLLGLAQFANAQADSLERPQLKEGDTWVYRETREVGPAGWNQSRDELTVTRVTSSTIYLAVKPSGSSQAPREIFFGSDWSRSRDVNGKDTVVNRPLSFPLSQGRSWDVSYTEQNPNKAHKLEKFDNRFTVVGYEMVEVPAGKFRALKIESEGHWEAQLAPGQSVVQSAQTGQGGATLTTQVQNASERGTSGKTYKAYWYVPEVKRWVKSVEEDYSSGGVRHERYTLELESYKLADAN